MSGQMSKRKGASYELKISKLFSSWSGKSFYRTPASGAWASQRLGQDEQTGDIVAPSSIKFPFSVELKNHEGISLENFMRSNGEIPQFFTQNVGDAVRAKKVPMLIVHKNRYPNYLAVPNNKVMLSDAIDNHLNYMTTTIKYKDALTDEDLYIDVIVMTLEDFFGLYTLDYLLDSHKEMFKNWYKIMNDGIGERRMGSKKTIKNTNVQEILSNLEQ